MGCEVNGGDELIWLIDGDEGGVVRWIVWLGTGFSMVVKWMGVRAVQLVKCPNWFGW
jgi:hypothetical protein